MYKFKRAYRDAIIKKSVVTLIIVAAFLYVNK